MKKTERAIEKYGKLIDDIDTLLNKCEYKSLRFAIPPLGKGERRFFATLRMTNGRERDCRGIKLSAGA